MPVRFVRARGNGDPERRYYEERIAATGEIETREQNWHDLFNALAWISFPLAKAAINAQHAAILEERGEAETRRRSPERDALTLFDEGGVLVASTDPSLQRLIVDFRWKELFWERRAELEANVRFIPFGHSLFEKMLDPHLGIVAKESIFGAAGGGFRRRCAAGSALRIAVELQQPEGDGAHAGAGDSRLASIDRGRILL